MQIESCSVLIIGSGAAGLRTAIELDEAGIDVLVLGKCKKREAHTKEAQGGINAALGTMDSEDTWQQHAADTIQDGGEINDPMAVELLCKHAADAVNELNEWGCTFAKESDGRLTQRFFGAARWRRACFVGAHTGLAMLNTLVDQAEKRDIRFMEEIYIVSLLRNEESVNGAIGLDMSSGELITIHASAVVLATGGHSRMFMRCSSHFWENNGDGIKLAFDVGASCMDMEMFQFHPTGMVWPEEAAGILVTEATRGEGGILTNSKGERFMKKYAPEKMELSARDIVARANWKEIAEGRGTKNGGVYLDISHKSKEYILERLPNIYDQLKKWNNIDISKEKMEVAPTAHYSMGGILVDHKTGAVLRCSAGCQPAERQEHDSASKLLALPNLFAVGEVSSGMHGGNRLGGNSLAECMVLGKLTGAHIAQSLRDNHQSPTPNHQGNSKSQSSIESVFQDLHDENGADPIETKKEIQKLMWNHCGVVRHGETMQKGLKELEKFRNLRFNTGSNFKQNEKLIATLDVLNMIPTCEMILKSALMREESRAAHYRSDVPETKEEWKKNIICTPSGDDIELTTRPVPEVPEEIAQHMKRRDDDATVHLLE